MIKFDKKEIIGMIHLAGPDAVDKAMEEIKIYEEEGLSGIIVENYHGGVSDVIGVLNALKINPTTMSVGVNILPNEYRLALGLAVLYDLDFIQLDHVSGVYQNGKTLDGNDLSRAIIETNANDIQIFGGIWPKYYTPKEGSVLKDDITVGINRCHAVVVTGGGTGIETPLHKVKLFKELIEISRKEFADSLMSLNGDVKIVEKPLIIGAGLTSLNVRESLEIAQGAIVGSAFKPNGRTHQMVDRDLVRVFMDEVRKIE